MCSAEWDNCHNNWHLKNLKIQDGRQNIEILLYVIKMAHIDLKKSIGQFHFKFNRCHMYIFMLIDASEIL